MKIHIPSVLLESCNDNMYYVTFRFGWFSSGRLAGFPVHHGGPPIAWHPFNIARKSSYARVPISYYNITDIIIILFQYFLIIWRDVYDKKAHFTLVLLKPRLESCASIRIPVLAWLYELLLGQGERNVPGCRPRRTRDCVVSAGTERRFCFSGSAAHLNIQSTERVWMPELL